MVLTLKRTYHIMRELLEDQVIANSKCQLMVIQLGPILELFHKFCLNLLQRWTTLPVSISQHHPQNQPSK